MTGQFHVRLVALAGLALICISAPAQSQATRSDPYAGPAVAVPGSHLRTLASADSVPYNLYVLLPPSYRDTNRAFPVVYLLDAQWDFPLVSGLIEDQRSDRTMPEVILVGITWGGPSPDYDDSRQRDLTPTKWGIFPHTGNGPGFLAFLRDQLIPFVDSAYRTNKSDRILMGNSLGGLFTLYTLFHQTALFSGYVASSPSLSWDNGITMTYERENAAKTRVLPVKVFMGLGALEGGKVGQFQELAAQIAASRYQGLAFETSIVDGAGHSGNKAETYSKGLRFVLLSRGSH